MDELNFAFADTTKADVQAMSQREMKSTEGAWGVPGAFAGGALGGIQYGFSCIHTRCTSAGFASNIGGGAVLGAVGGPMSLTRFYFSRHAAAGGKT